PAPDLPGGLFVDPDMVEIHQAGDVSDAVERARGQHRPLVIEGRALGPDDRPGQHRAGSDLGQLLAGREAGPGRHDGGIDLLVLAALAPLGAGLGATEGASRRSPTGAGVSSGSTVFGTCTAS